MKLLLLRESKGPSDPYHITLGKLGQVFSFPVLSINFINFKALGELLKNLDKYSAIIATSANAVKAIASTTKTHNISHSEMNKWKEMKCYVTGKATEKAASALGFQCKGSDSNNSENLSMLIIEDNSMCEFKKPLLFCCGQLKRETLPTRLQEANIHLKIVTVYETTEHPDLISSIVNHRGNNDREPCVIVFFSPSGVNYALHKFKQVYEGYMESLHFAAIGGTTATALTEHGFTPCCVASKPTPEDLGSAIEQFSKQTLFSSGID